MMRLFLISSLMILSGGCCVGFGGHEMGIYEKGETAERSVLLPIVKYKTEPQFNVHQLKCEDVRVPGGKVVGSVEFPLSMCVVDPKKRSSFADIDSFSAEIDGKNVTFKGLCSVNRRGDKFEYWVNLDQK